MIPEAKRISYDIIATPNMKQLECFIKFLFLFASFCSMQPVLAYPNVDAEWKKYHEEVLASYRYPGIKAAQGWIDLYEPHLPAMEDAWRAEVLMMLGGFYYTIGDEEKALIKFTMSKKIWQKLGHIDYMMKACAAIGALYSSLGRHEKSITILEEGASHSEYPRIGHGELTLRLLLSAQYLDLRRYEDAIGQAEKVVNGNREFGQWEGEARGTLVAAVSFAQLGQIEEAASLFEQSYQLYIGRSSTYRNENYRQKAIARRDIAEQFGIDVSTW